MQINSILFIIILVLVVQTLVIFSLNKDLDTARDSICYLFRYLHKNFGISADEIIKNGIYYAENQIDIFEEKEKK